MPTLQVPGSLNLPVVFDVGGLTTRAGFAGDESPRIVCPSIVGEYTDASCGTRRSAIELEALGWGQPDMSIKKVYSARFDEYDSCISRLLQHSYNKLGVVSSECPALLSDGLTSTKASRRRAAEIMFEDFGTPALCMARTAELAAISTGRTTALVVDLGAVSNSAVAVVDGQVWRNPAEPDPRGPDPRGLHLPTRARARAHAHRERAHTMEARDGRHRQR